MNHCFHVNWKNRWTHGCCKIRLMNHWTRVSWKNQTTRGNHVIHLTHVIRKNLMSRKNRGCCTSHLMIHSNHGCWMSRQKIRWIRMSHLSRGYDTFLLLHCSETQPERPLSTLTSNRTNDTMRFPAFPTPR